MNIFILDDDPVKAAHYHCDQHVVRMLMEYAQILCDVHSRLDGETIAKKRIKGLLRPRLTHVEHPCSLWASEAIQNYNWLHSLLIGLTGEYLQRYGRQHKFASLVFNLSTVPLELDAYKDMTRQTPFIQDMPEQYKHRSAVKAYRDYYFHEKRDMVTWKCETPKWWIVKLTQESGYAS